MTNTSIKAKSKESIKELMQKKPTTIQFSTPLSSVVKILIKEQASGLVVVNKSHNVIGFVTEHDCHKAMLISSYYCDKPMTVNEVMTKDIATFSTNQSIADIAIQTLDNVINVYPVVEQNVLVGVLKRSDILTVLNENLSLCTQLSTNI
jgi:signal-transduction protein with cAMP-binding, CBS, and nucleotidyltransferase domain